MGSCFIIRGGLSLYEFTSETFNKIALDVGRGVVTEPVFKNLVCRVYFVLFPLHTLLTFLSTESTVEYTVTSAC